MNSQLIRSPDGFELCYQQRGDQEGISIFWLHGTPGCRLSQAVTESALESIHARVITYDRPGYGMSTRRPGRTVADSVSDVVAIADHLNLDRFMVTGRSGGAPHALAAAALIPDRLTRVRSVAGPAPYPSAGLDWFAGMDPANVREFQCALRGGGELIEMIDASARTMVEQLKTDPIDFLADFDLPEGDRAAGSDPLVTTTLREAIPEALRNGVSGWVDDDLAIMQYWGFEVRDIAVPVEVQYGMRDVIVPPAHSRWLAEHLPHAVRVSHPESGHFSTPDQELAMLHQMVTGT